MTNYIEQVKSRLEVLTDMRLDLNEKSPYFHEFKRNLDDSILFYSIALDGLLKEQKKHDC